MDGLYQDIIIMLTIFFVGLWGMYHYYQLKNDFNELQADFHRCNFLTKGDDTLKMQDDIISLKQSCVNLNAKINKNEKWAVTSIGDLTKIQTTLVAFMESCEIPTEDDVLHVQDVLDKMAEMGLRGRVNINPDKIIETADA